jgi:lipid II:glycine glycyltransferase (peptidoglycan interpeptide bridge formation enzyme)
MAFMKFRAFEKMVRSLGDNIEIWVAYHRDAVQGCIVVPFSQHSAYYVYGGSIPQPIVGATNLLHWEAIRHFRGLMVKQYDFVGVRIDPERGSKQEGLMQYKQRFGGRLSKGFMWKYSISQLKNAVYSLAVRFLRGGDIVDHERHKLDSA